MRRERDLKRLVNEAPYDVLVVGGGAAGAGTLRAAGLRKLKAALCERDDFGSGASSRSSRLIHGGLRYLEHGHLGLVRESLAERRILLAIAPHLIEPLPIHIPVYRGGHRPSWKLKLGLHLYDGLAGGARLGPSRMLGPEALPGLRSDGLEAIGVVIDARARTPERVVIETLVDAERLGAVAVNHLELVRLEKSGRGLRAELHDRVGGQRIEVEAGVVVNAAGPWVAEIERRAGGATRALRPTRGSHLLLPSFPGAPQVALLVEAKRDGRPFFIVPVDGALLVGTTEVAHEGDPLEAVATSAEVHYLLAELEAVWPAARDVHPFAAYAGVRPLPVGEGNVARANRRHRLEHAGHKGGPPGLFSLIGGKLTTHRLEGELAARTAAAYLRRGDRGIAEPTRDRALPGAQCDPEPTLNPRSLATRFALPEPDAAALLRRWGCRAWAVGAGIGEERPIAGTGGLYAAEIRFALQNEGAVGLDDVLYRRTGTWESPLLTGDGVRAAAAVWAAAQLGEEVAASGGVHDGVQAVQAQLLASAEAARVIDLLARFHARRLA